MANKFKVKNPGDEAAAAAKIKNANPQAIGTGAMQLVPFKSTAVAEFGNKFLVALVHQAGMEESAKKLQAESAIAKEFLTFEMTRAVFSLATAKRGTKDEFDVADVYGEKGKVEKLNNRVLIAMGILKKEINDETETVVFNWTDQSVANQYHYSKALQEKDEPEYNRRLANRKRLNLRLSDAYKTVCALLDSKLTPDDLFYSEDEDGKMVPTIRNAPKRIGGEAGTIQLNKRTPTKGADLSPTMTSLIKIANERHKAPEADRADKGEKREAEKMGMTDEAFGQIVNSLRRAIQKQEGSFTDDMRKQIVALGDFLATVIGGLTADKDKDAA
jgi:hypothetical protein